MFPNNVMTWVGASIVGGLNEEIERFMCTEEDFLKNDCKIQDRFGDAYLFASREDPYLNSEFEYRNQFIK